MILQRADLPFFFFLQPIESYEWFDLPAKLYGCSSSQLSSFGRKAALAGVAADSKQYRHPIPTIRQGFSRRVVPQIALDGRIRGMFQNFSSDDATK